MTVEIAMERAISAVNRGATVSTRQAYRGYPCRMLRDLPSIDRLLTDPAWDEAPTIPRVVRKRACRAVVDRTRGDVLSGTLSAVPAASSLARDAVEHARSASRPALRRVVNGTGVILHTNLGRAPLAPAALEAIAQTAGGYTNLEMDLVSGQRDSRHGRLAEVFARVIGCEDVVIANNNAAAVFLALCAVAGEGTDVVVSRGELVEIGGSFRMPEIMEQSGARLREVGATNCTHLRDFERALADGARVVMKVHRSNFAQIGFTSEVSIEELGELARKYDALLLHDLGMGVLDLAPGVARDSGQPGESVRRSLDAGADVVLFSGDKLLGGPQAGILAGRAEVLERIRKHPVMRLVRPGKLCLLALEATLRAWDADPTGADVPAARMMSRTANALKLEADTLASRLRRPGLDVSVVSTKRAPGGGSLPGTTLDSWAVSLSSADHSDAQLAASLRTHEPPVVARIEDGLVLIDLGTLFDGDADIIVDALRSAE
jgi:L-seryl-tRNA(Ser) seleniumtransferase